MEELVMCTKGQGMISFVPCYIIFQSKDTLVQPISRRERFHSEFERRPVRHVVDLYGRQCPSYRITTVTHTCPAETNFIGPG